jgi:hypothetical protein
MHLLSDFEEGREFLVRKHTTTPGQGGRVRFELCRLPTFRSPAGLHPEPKIRKNGTELVPAAARNAASGGQSASSLIGYDDR